MDDETAGTGEEPAETAEGEPGRDEVAGRGGGHPGHDLDEGKAYEEQQETE